MDDKEQVLKKVINCFENLNNNIGEIITEYHWREFCVIIKQIEETFPEYKLIEYPEILNDVLNNDIIKTNDDW